jgi:RHS repeat-associated protein
MRQPASSLRLRLSALGFALAAFAAPALAEPPGRIVEMLQAPSGVTALSGRVLTQEGRPLVNVALRDGAAGTRTDDQGRFLLTKLQSGVSVLTIDGRHADADGKTDFGLFEVQVTVDPSRTTVLPFTSYLPKIDHAHEVSFPSPTTSEVVIKAATIPGLELHIPPGAILTDPDGKPVTKVGITPIPLDRTPFPLPRNVEVPVYFTAQPGGATITGTNGSWLGAQIYYPNYHHELPKARASFYKYDPYQNGWTTYGTGRVSADGTQIIPDKDTRIYDLTGAMINTGQTPGDPCGCGQGGPGATAAEPVDLASGHWIEEHDDLVIPDILPLNLTRTYQSGDFNARDFGVGQNLIFNMFLNSTQQYQVADLILPSGTPIHYTRIQNGDNGFVDAHFVNTTSGLSPFYQSHIDWNGNGWNMTLQDGTILVFGENAPLQAIQDRYGHRITVARTGGANGLVSQVSSPHGRTITFTRDSGNRIVQAQDNAGRVVSYTYDSSGRMQTFTDADGGVTTFGWDSGNHITTITDARGNVTVTNLYDADDRVTTQTAADGGSYSFAYTGGSEDTFASETDVTDPIGSVRKVTFTASGFAATDDRAVGTSVEQDTRYSYDPTSSFLLTKTDPLGRTTTYGHDTLGDVTSVTWLTGTAGQISAQFTFGPFKQLASVADPLGLVTTIGLDGLGTPVSVTDPLGNLTTLGYDSEPYLGHITDPLGNQTSIAYDLDVPASLTDPLGRVSTLYADALGRAIRAADPLGNVTTAVYDPAYGVHQATQPRGEVTTVNYLPTGLIGSVVDARGGTTAYAYDAKSRVILRTDPVGKADQVTAYDGNDNVLTRVDRKGQTATYTYDPLNRITSASYADGSVVSYTWDTGNRLTQIQDSVSGTIARAYDTLDRLVSETTPQGTVAYTYDADGRRTTMTVPNQAQVTYAYDNAGELTQVAQGTALVTLAYDADGRRTSLTLPNGIVATYGYDTASQLTGITYALGSSGLGGLGYAYDLSGNQIGRGGALFQSVLPAPVTSGTYDAANRLTQWTTPGGGVSPTYDANGNLLNDGNRGYSWDARNRLTAVPGAASFSYDGLDRRQSSTVNGNAVAYLYDGFDTVQEQGPALANILTGLGVDERFVRTEGSAASTYLTDALGSTVALADGTGTIRTSYGYDPYGNTSATGTANDNGYQYAGRQNEGTDLYYNRARYYNPAWGRFIAEDPIGLAGGINRYAYAGGNPLQFTDPSGLAAALAGGGGELVELCVADPPACAALGAAGEYAYAGRLVGGLLGGILCAATSGDTPPPPPPPANEDDPSKRPPPGTKPIDETAWSGDHGKIKGEIGLGPTDHTGIDPDGNVWGQNPDGSWTNYGPASDYTGSGKPSGKRGKDRGRGRRGDW